MAQLELTQMRKDAHELYELGDAIRGEYEGKEMPGEKVTESKDYFGQAEALIERIKLEEEADLQRKWFDEPVGDLPLSAKTGDGGRETGGTKARRIPQSLKNVDVHDRRFLKSIGVADDVEFFESFGDRLKAVVKAATRHSVDPRLRAEEKLLKAMGLNEAIGSEGGFLVGIQTVADLYTRTFERSPLAGRARMFQVGEGYNGIKIRAIKDASRARGSQWGGVQAYWLNEAGTKTASKPKFRTIELKLEKLIGLCYATDENLEDAIQLESIINQSFPDVMGFEVDNAIWEGDGAGKPVGMQASPAVIPVAKEAGQTAATIVFENITKMWSRMWAPSRANAVWLINQDIEPELMNMSLAVGTGGIPVYLPASGLSGSPYASLMGRPVIPIEHASALGTVGDISLVDYSQYGMVEKGGIQMASSIHVQFLTDETTFRFVMRIGGESLWDTVLTPFKGNTKSPFVVLATRA